MVNDDTNGYSDTDFLLTTNVNGKLKEDIFKKENGIPNGLSVVWKNLSVIADIKKSHAFKPTEHNYKTIIHNIDGAIPPGHLVAILGASGSGKSTLMTVLANRSPGGLIVEGDIRIGGRRIGNYMRHLSGFVYQDDLFLSSLTVMEHLNFAGRLKLDRNVTKEQRHQLINTVLTELGLWKCANNRIGNASSGNEKITLSGGERKRLSCATELLTNPAVLFCDEPTTGLDSFSALKLMTLMKDLAREKQKTIVCSIHQPNEQIFLLFHQIILMSNGRVAFCGTGKDAITFFQSQGYRYTEDQNPADFMIKSLASVPGQEIARSKKVIELCSEFSKSDYAKPINKYIQDEINKYHDQGNDFRIRKIEHPSWIYRCFFVTYRRWLSTVRDPAVFYMRLIQKIILALIIGACMQGAVTNTQKGIQALQGVVFALIGQNFFPAIYVVINQIPKQLPVFYREHANGMTTALMFFVSNIISLLPGFIFDPLIFTAIIYWFAGLRQTLYAFSLTCFITILILNASAAFGMVLSMLCKNREVAITVITPMDTTMLILSGFYVKLSTVPWIIVWFRYISWFTYACEAVFIVQLHDVNYISCPADPTLPCLRTSKDVLDHYDYNAENLWVNISKMIGLYLLMNIFSYICLVVRMRHRSV